MSDDEKLQPLVQAVEAATGHRPHLATVLRWCQNGSHGVFLESKMLAGRRLTTVEFVNKFVADCTRATSKRPVDRITSAKQRQRSVESANNELDRMLGPAK